MLGRHHNDRGGFTLVELLVVLTIIALLAAVAVPGILSIVPQTSLSNSSLDLFRIMKSAQVYASTFNVNTAVVYGLDNWVPPNDPRAGVPALAQPATDPITGEIVRHITTAAIMYQLPLTTPNFEDRYVPIPEEEGTFQSLAGNSVILLRTPERFGGAQTFYRSTYPGYLPQVTGPAAASGISPDINNIALLGMRAVEAYLDGTGPYRTDPGISPAQAATEDVVVFPAHIFEPSGQLAASDVAPERVRVWVAPNPNAGEYERVLGSDPTTEAGQTLVAKEIFIFRSTGRIKLADRE